MTRDEILSEKVQLLTQLVERKASEDYFTFLKYLFPRQVKWNWHHRYVCDQLQDWAEGDTSHLMLFMPPQHQKTTMQTIYLPAWIFGHRPDAECLMVMYNATMANKYNKKVQRIMLTDKYQRIFETRIAQPGLKSESGVNYSRTSEEFEIVDNIGFLRSAGVDGGIAGNPAKFTFMDDVIKNAAEANSKVYRDRVYDWYTDEVETRQHNDSKIVFSITRRHEDDLSGRILKRDGTVEQGGKWKVILLPALKEDHTNPDDPRLIGEALFPELHSKEKLMEIQEKNPTTFVGLYQQRPFKLQGNIIKKDQIKIVDEFTLPTEAFTNPVHVTVDTAYTKDKHHDPSGMMAYFEYRGDIYVVDYRAGHWEISDLSKQIINFTELNGSQRSIVYIEPKASGKSVIQRIRELTDGINLQEYKLPEGDKTARLSANQPYFESGRVFFLKGTWNEDVINEICGFPNMVHDEAVDCINMAITQGFERSAIRPFDWEVSGV